MSNAQFISLMEFGRSNNKRSDKRSMRDIVSEAVRIPENSSHVSQPQRPILVHGESPSLMCDKLEAIANQARSANGNKLRQDARILLGGVISYPKRISEFDDQCLKDPTFRAWIKRSRQFLKDEFGRDFRSAVLHLDEGYPHIHFYCHQSLRNDMTLDLKRCHPGLRVEQQLRDTLKRKPKKTELAKASALGLKRFQDRFHNEVSVHFKHKRLTVKRKRLQQAEFKKQQAAKQELELKNTNIDRLGVELDKKRNVIHELKVENKTQQQELSRLQRYTAKLEASIQRLTQKLGLGTPKSAPSLTPRGP